MMPWTSESDCTITSCPPQSYLLLCPPPSSPHHLLNSGRAVGKKPSFFSCFFVKHSNVAVALFSPQTFFLPQGRQLIGRKLGCSEPMQACKKNTDKGAITREEIPTDLQGKTLRLMKQNKKVSGFPTLWH